MNHHPVRDEILLLLNPGGKPLWHGGPTTTAVLDDVPLEMAMWDPGNGRTSIWGLALHMAYWKFAVRRRIQGLPDTGFERAPDNFPDLPIPPSEAAWDDDRALLVREEAALRELVASLDEERLQEPLSKDYRVADQLFGIAMHDAHHIAQILLIKRLWEDRLPG